MERSKDICRLCGAAGGLEPIEGPDRREYYLCGKCYLINVAKKDLPDARTEKERYLTHQNSIESEGYVRFLSQAIDPARDFINKDMIGLDYGCGPAPTLSRLLNARGYACQDYDPFFVEHDLARPFGFIFCTEVFEHFFYPAEEIKKLRALLEDDGILVVMTEMWRNTGDLAGWHYARDDSHVAFYHSRTFDHISENFGFVRSFDDGKRVVILKKTSAPSF